MPRYHFNTEGATPFEDQDGFDLSNDAAARVEAVRLVGSLMSDYPERVGGAGLRLTVVDGAGALILHLDVSTSAQAGERPHV